MWGCFSVFFLFDHLLQFSFSSGSFYSPFDNLNCKTCAQKEMRKAPHTPSKSKKKKAHILCFYDNFKFRRVYIT